VQLRCNCGRELINPSYLDKNYFTECPACHEWLYFDSQIQNIVPVEYIKPTSYLRVFFSHSFTDADRAINHFFENLLRFHYIDVYTIESDTRSIDKIQKAREGIKKAKFVFMVIPKRYHYHGEESGNDIWKGSEWIQNEIGMAYAFKKDIIAIVEEGVKDEGMLKDIRWCYSFNRDRLWPIWIEDNPRRTIEQVKAELLHLLDAISGIRREFF